MTADVSFHLMQRQDESSDSRKLAYIGYSLGRADSRLWDIMDAAYTHDPEEASDDSTIPTSLDIAFRSLREVTHTLKLLSPESRKEIRPLIEEQVQNMMARYDAAAEAFSHLRFLKDNYQTQVGPYNRLVRMLELVQE